MELRELLQNITPPDEAAREQAHRRWAACAKPLGSLGLLETALEDWPTDVLAALPGGRAFSGGATTPADEVAAPAAAPGLSGLMPWYPQHVGAAA